MPDQVPPPVDALLCFEHDFSTVAEHPEGDVTVCLGCGERGDEAEPAWLDRVASAAAVYGYPATSEGAYDDLVAEVRAVWASGVAEGRRQAAKSAIDAARVLDAELQGDPELAADAAVAGEVEGLWQAAKLADAALTEQERALG